MLKIKGKLKLKLDVESGEGTNGKQWRKQGFLVDTGDQYNPDVAFSMFGDDKIDSLNSVSIGDEVTVLFNVQSREWKGKYFTNLDAFKILTEEESEKAGVVGSSEPEVDTDDLPFNAR